MTQESELPGQGDAEVEDQVSPSPADSDANEAPDPDTLLGNALLGELGIHDEAPEAPEPKTDDDEPEATEDGEEPPAAEAQSPADEMQRWVEQVAANPKSINQIPAKHHPAVMQAAIDSERAIQRRAVQLAYEQGKGDGSTQAEQALRIRQAVEEIDTLKRDDPEGYIAWRDEKPELASAYDAAKYNATPQGAARTESVNAVANAIRQAAAPVVAQLANYPAAKARLEAKAQSNPNLYGMTPEGLAQLTADIAAEIAADQSALLTKQNEPARKAVEQRAQAQAERRGAPRIDAAEGRKGNEPLGNDIETLLADGWAKEMQLARSR